MVLERRTPLPGSAPTPEPASPRPFAPIRRLMFVRSSLCPFRKCTFSNDQLVFLTLRNPCARSSVRGEEIW